jgi:hypothetical protein
VGSSTEVKHAPQHLKVKGLNRAISNEAGNGIERECQEKKLYNHSFWFLGCHWPIFDHPAGYVHDVPGVNVIKLAFLHHQKEAKKQEERFPLASLSSL